MNSRTDLHKLRTKSPSTPESVLRGKLKQSRKYAVRPCTQAQMPVDSAIDFQKVRPFSIVAISAIIVTLCASRAAISLAISSIFAFNAAISVSSACSSSFFESRFKVSDATWDAALSTSSLHSFNSSWESLDSRVPCVLGRLAWYGDVLVLGELHKAGVVGTFFLFCIGSPSRSSDPTSW